MTLAHFVRIIYDVHVVLTGHCESLSERADSRVFSCIALGLPKAPIPCGSFSPLSSVQRRPLRWHMPPSHHHLCNCECNCPHHCRCNKECHQRRNLTWLSARTNPATCLMVLGHLSRNAMRVESALLPTPKAEVQTLLCAYKHTHTTTHVTCALFVNEPVSHTHTVLFSPL